MNHEKPINAADYEHDRKLRDAVDPMVRSGSSLTTVTAAVNNRYPITEEIRKMLVSQSVLIIAQAKNKKWKLGAARLLLAMDQLNAVRERQAAEAESDEAAVAVELLRAGMENEAVCEALASASEALADAMAVQTESLDESEPTRARENLLIDASEVRDAGITDLDLSR